MCLGTFLNSLSSLVCVVCVVCVCVCVGVSVCVCLSEYLYNGKDIFKLIVVKSQTCNNKVIMFCYNKQVKVCFWCFCFKWHPLNVCCVKYFPLKKYNGHITTRVSKKTRLQTAASL